MRKFKNTKLFNKALAFLLTLAMATGIVGMGFESMAAGRTAIMTSTLLYSPDGNHRPFGNVHFQVFINGRQELNDRTSPRGGFHWDRASPPC